MSLVHFGSFYPLSNVFSDWDESPEEFLPFAVACVAWGIEKDHGRAIDRDDILRPFDLTTTKRGLLLRLAAVDPKYHALLRRGFAALIAAEPPKSISPLDRQLIAFLLTEPHPKPDRNARHIGRNLMFVVALRLLIEAGYRPLHNAIGRSQSSGCDVVLSMLEDSHGVRLTYAAIEKVWKDRRKVLLRAGFSEEVSDFMP